jgi:serine O-acetyltransferase
VNASDFSFLAYVAADLRRYRAVVNSRPLATRLGPAEWLSVFSPRFFPMVLCRAAHRFYRWRLGPVARFVSLFNFVLFGIEIAPRCPIGKGLYIPHSQGVVIGAASIGTNATIYQGVTLGAKELDHGYTDERRPVVGDNVLIGAGAKVLGGIHIGSGARIGANAVVIDPVPAGALVVGPAARIIEQGAIKQ